MDRTKYILGSIISLVVLIPSMAIDAAGTKILWQWFMVDHFNFEPLTIKAAIGIALLKTQLFYSPDRYQDSPEQEMRRRNPLELLLEGLLMMALLLALGFIFKSFL